MGLSVSSMAESSSPGVLRLAGGWRHPIPALRCHSGAREARARNPPVALSRGFRARPLGRPRNDNGSKPALDPRERLAQRLGEAFALGRRELAGDDDLLASGDEAEALQPVVLVALAVELRPQGIEAPLAAGATVGHMAEHQLDRGQHDLLEGAARPEVHSKGDVKGEAIEAEEARHGPEAEHDEGDADRAGGEAA